MSATTELLDRLFKPAQVLLVDAGDTTKLEAMLHSVCAVELSHYTGQESDQHYDMVMVGMPRPDQTLMDKLKKSGPLVMVGQGRSLPTFNEPITILPSVTERGITDLFKTLKIKMRTPEVARLIAQML